MPLRDERPADRPAVRRVHERAFGAAGGTVADVADGLRPLLVRHLGLSVVAEEDGDVVGHVMSTRALLDAPHRLVEVQVLSPLGVLPEHQGRGVGSALVREVLRRLAATAAPLVFLEGDPVFYGRLGFEPAGALGFRKPSLRIPDAAFQVARLPAYDPRTTGTLVYPEVFWEHDAVGLREEAAGGDAGEEAARGGEGRHTPGRPLADVPGMCTSNRPSRRSRD